MKKFQLICGDAKDEMKKLSPNFFHSCICSPPYFNLRTYYDKSKLGLEKSPDEYVNNLVKIFREVKRVLRKDGTLWVVIGDTYSTPKKGNTQDILYSSERKKIFHSQKINKKTPVGLKSKNLIGIPWKLAFALQKDGWYLRCDIIWRKNAHPDGAKDRPTISHEYVFLLSKSEKYFYDYFAIAELTTTRRPSKNYVSMDKKNKRSVWDIPVASSGGVHTAVFPEELAKNCILAGTSERGCCINCKKPWKRIIEKQPSKEIIYLNGSKWTKDCDCETSEIENCIVLDPFSGMATTGIVALKNNRDYVGIDINKDFIEESRKRLFKLEPIFAEEIIK